MTGSESQSLGAKTLDILFNKHPRTQDIIFIYNRIIYTYCIYITYMVSDGLLTIILPGACIQYSSQSEQIPIRLKCLQTVYKIEKSLDKYSRLAPDSLY